jgi:hypothetical protein
MPRLIRSMVKAMHKMPFCVAKCSFLPQCWGSKLLQQGKYEETELKKLNSIQN